MVVVEVKTRNSDFFGDPQNFVTPSKIKLLVKAANEYVISNDLGMEVRFDIIAVIKNKTIEKMEHFENAFYHFYFFISLNMLLNHQNFQVLLKTFCLYLTQNKWVYW